MSHEILLKEFAFKHRLRSAEHHRGTHEEFAKRTNALLSPRSVLDPQRRAKLAANAHTWCSDDRALIVAAARVCDSGGDAAGIDGVHPSDLSREMIPPLARQLRDRLRSGDYQPAPCRKIEVAKASGAGTRTVEIPSIRDRIVGTAVSRVLTRFFEPEFDERSFGFRPRRNRLLALAELLTVSDVEARRCLIVDDLVDAFGRVPLPRLWQILQARLPGGEKFVDLMRSIIGHERTRGLPQGHPVSPLLLNIYLDHVLDRWWRSELRDIPLLRTADDLAILCRSHHEAERVYPQIRQRLQAAGFTLHGATIPHLFDARHEPVEFLGFSVQLQDSDWQITLPSSLQRRVQRRIQKLPPPPDGLPSAVRGIEGLISQLGPTYGDTDRTLFCGQLAAELATKGLHAAIDQTRWHQLWQAAWMRWQATLIRQRKRHDGDAEDEDDDA